MCAARVRRSIPEGGGSIGEVSKRAISRWEKLTFLNAYSKKKVTMILKRR